MPALSLHSFVAKNLFLFKEFFAIILMGLWDRERHLCLSKFVVSHLTPRNSKVREIWVYALQDIGRHLDRPASQFPHLGRKGEKLHTTWIW